MQPSPGDPAPPPPLHAQVLHQQPLPFLGLDQAPTFPTLPVSTAALTPTSQLGNLRHRAVPWHGLGRLGQLATPGHRPDPRVLGPGPPPGRRSPSCSTAPSARAAGSPPGTPAPPGRAGRSRQGRQRAGWCQLGSGTPALPSWWRDTCQRAPPTQPGPSGSGTRQDTRFPPSPSG